MSQYKWCYVFAASDFWAGSFLIYGVISKWYVPWFAAVCVLIAMIALVGAVDNLVEGVVKHINYLKRGD